MRVIPKGTFHTSLVLLESCTVSVLYTFFSLSLESCPEVVCFCLSQHVVFGICRMIDVLVPDIPESLELKIKRERYLAKQALQDSETMLKVSVGHRLCDEHLCFRPITERFLHLKVAAGKDDEEDNELIPNGGMVLDLTAELGAPVETVQTTSREVTTKHKPDT